MQWNTPERRSCRMETEVETGKGSVEEGKGGKKEPPLGQVPGNWQLGCNFPLSRPVARRARPCRTGCGLRQELRGWEMV